MRMASSTHRVVNGMVTASHGTRSLCSSFCKRDLGYLLVYFETAKKNNNITIHEYEIKPARSVIGLAGATL